jgi:hypothetical protein
MFSEHANAMALAMNIATPEQANEIARQLFEKDNHNYIKRASGITMVTPAMSYYLHKGLCNYGYIDESFELFRERFDQMLEPGTNGTLWEEWWLDAIGRTGKLQKGRTRSDAQTESAFPPALFAEYLLGISPTKPGMKEVVVTRKQTSLKNIKGEIPTPEGKLVVQWKINSKNEGELHIDVPGNIKVQVDLKSIGVSNGKITLTNGQTYNYSFENEPYLTLDKGRHLLEFKE